ncbi:MAG: AsmA-like C-terminal region-containing protein [Vicinamibacterales bacterium]
MRKSRVVGMAAVAAGSVALLFGASILALRSTWTSNYVERRAISFLEARLNARVEVGTIELILYPSLAVMGTEFRATRRDSSESVPFVAIDRFQISGSPWALWRRHVSSIELDGLELRIVRGASGQPAMTRPKNDVLVDRVVVRNGRLVIVPRNPQKVPLEFALHEVSVTDFGFDRSSTYAAQITNPKPTALIQAEGHIGPWDATDFATTPLDGVYLLANGDLGTIKGIGGALESSGKFAGVLERIRVEGTTTSRDFQLKMAGNAVPLETQYVAIVDGTSGDTILEQVNATLGSSRLTARGSIASMPGAKARAISLRVTADDARFEDLLRLAIKGDADPPMRGLLNLDTSFVLPPSDEDIPLRLDLNGTFSIAQGQFTSDAVQDKVDALSRRGRGQPKNQNVNNVLSAFGGTFALEKGVLSLPRLQFSVNGARVDLAGNYRLPTETMAFRGTLSLDAPVSKTVTGFKSILLKAVDPLFRRNGAGTQIPIAITGTVAKPAFKVEARRIFSRK